MIHKVEFVKWISYQIVCSILHKFQAHSQKQTASPLVMHPQNPASWHDEIRGSGQLVQVP